MARKGRKRVIIKAGQIVRVGNELCTCSTDPWNANAVCGLIRVCKRLKERNDYQFAEFPIPETAGIKLSFLYYIFY